MVKHGALSKSHVYQLLRSNDARVRRAAFTLLESSNPKLRTNSQLFVEITRFIWNANPSYDVYHEFTKRHFQANYKVYELVSARVRIEQQNKQSGATDDLTDNTRPYEKGFFTRLFRNSVMTPLYSASRMRRSPPTRPAHVLPTPRRCSS